MRRSEMATARGLLERLNNSVGTGQPPVRDGIDKLAAAVLRRELGLERFTVLAVLRDDNLEIRLQVLSFAFRDDTKFGGEWFWELEGRSLRKNGSLGHKSTGIGFRCATLRRRHLDGSWKPIRLLARG